MTRLFLIFLATFLISVPFHILALEREKLRKRFENAQARTIGNVIGIISGWLLFVSWAGIWFAPQPDFALSNLVFLLITVPVVGLQLSLTHLVVGLPFLILGTYFGLKAVSKLSVTVSQTQLPSQFVSEGIYSRCRHPQYLGGLLAHIGLTLIMSSLYSLLATPLVFIAIYVMSYAEEKQLVSMFESRYEEYRKKVPMFMPQITREASESE
ncbi:MAG: isoprenylcysteine carboxylmethyltransferase family protein [Candidatus Thorarchaeota archaeon]